MLRKIHTALLILSFLSSQVTFGQPFVEMNLTGMQGVATGFAAWGDYNNDGLPDCFLSGAESAEAGGVKQARLYDNNGNGSFRVSSGIIAPGLVEGDAAWGDYNNDGWADLLVTGTTNGMSSGRRTILYRNTKEGRLEEVSAGLPGLYKSHCNFVDYDNDGDQDIFLTGLSAGEETVIRLYDNQRGAFTDSGIALSILPPGIRGEGGNNAVWSDLDQDGDQDLVMAQNDVVSFRIVMYQNNGDRTFTLNPLIRYPGRYMDLGCSDYDGDGLPDLFMSGAFTQTSGIPNANHSQFFASKSRGDLTFATEFQNSLGGGVNGSLAVGDYDLDGWSDALINGRNNGTPKTFIQRNRGGDGTFMEETGFGLAGTQAAGAWWVDFDQDRDLDILVTGTPTVPASNALIRLYRNNTPRVNRPPTPPVHLRVEVSGTTAILRWDPATDAETPQQVLTYNVRIGTRRYPHSILSGVSPGANAENSPASGNAGQNQFLIIKDLPNGCFEWQVQAIDNAYAASAPSEPVTFSVQVPGNDLIPAVGSANYCQGEATMFTATDLWASDSLRWNFDDPASGAGNHSTLPDPGHVFSGPGTFQVQLTTYTCGVPQSTSQPVTILPRPQVELGQDTVLCQGQILRLALEATGTYVWSTGAKGSEILVTEPGRYWVTVSHNGCTGSDTVAVTFRPPLRVNLGPDLATCLPGPVALNAANENAVYVWSTGAVSPSIAVDASGTYWVRVSNGACTASDTVHIALNGLSDVAVQATPAVASGNEPILFTAGGSEGVHWQWDFGDNTSGTGQQVEHSYATEGSYQVTLRVTNARGCTVLSTVHVQVEPHLFIPNVITPNHDSFNDVFQIEYNGRESFQLTIVDRWGKPAFTSSSVHQPWTGEGCSPGMYYYCLKVGSRRYTGWVHLLR